MRISVVQQCFYCRLARMVNQWMDRELIVCVCVICYPQKEYGSIDGFPFRDARKANEEVIFERNSLGVEQI